MPDWPYQRLITTASDLDALVAHLRQRGRFAFDTEFVAEETFEPVLCLVQVSTRDRLALIDPMALRDLSPFWDVVLDPEIEVVMHAAGQDLRIGQIQTGRLPRRVFDVQIVAGLVGFGYPLSLNDLVYQTLGITLAGGETRTDWRRRPLSDAQLRYALDDVRHLLDVADRLQARLAQLGRTEWAEAELRDALERLVEPDENDRWRRLPGLHQLNRRGMEIARRLFDWRQEQARVANRPPRQVMRDDLLVAIAKRQPAHRRDLEALRDFNRPHLLNRAGEVLQIVSQTLKVPADALPEHPERPKDSPGLSMVVSLLNAAMAFRCAQHRLAVGLVGSTTDLKDLVRWHTQGRDEDRRPALLRGWRQEVCGQVLLEVLDGRCALRVADPLADVPVTLETTEP